MKYRLLPVALAAALPLAAATAASGPDLSTVQQKFSYGLGVQLGQNLERQGLTDIDVPALAAAVQDVLSGAKLRLSSEEMRAAIHAYQQKLLAQHRAAAQKNLEASNEFLAANKKKPGVVTLPSGLQYKILHQGNGKQPTKSDTVVVNYRGRLIDGRQFDSSYDRGKPTTLEIDKVIKGWQEALPLMHVGGKWRLFVPPALAYGEQGAGSAIGPNQALVFDVELLSVK